jgi:hypothetical protein
MARSRSIDRKLCGGLDDGVQDPFDGLMEQLVLAARVVVDRCAIEPDLTGYVGELGRVIALLLKQLSGDSKQFRPLGGVIGAPLGFGGLAAFRYVADWAHYAIVARAAANSNSPHCRQSSRRNRWRVGRRRNRRLPPTGSP